jgi:hypothetical protein
MVVAVGVGSGVKVGEGVSVGVAVGSTVDVAAGRVGVAVAVDVGEPVGTRVTVEGATVDTRGETDCEVVHADVSTVIPSVAESNINL